MQSYWASEYESLFKCPVLIGSLEEEEGKKARKQESKKIMKKKV